MRGWCVSPLVLLLSAPALAQEPTCSVGSTCVPAADLRDMVTALKEQKCQKTQVPQYTLDPITVVTDKDGRVFVSGATPHPYTLKMTWCGYDVTAQGKVNVQAAMKVPPVAGWRFRPKAMVGVLGVAAFTRDRMTDAVDVGIGLEPVYYHSWNLSAMVGLRSLGVGIGLDVTKNFGLQVGYAVTWLEWQHNPYVGAYFALW